MKLFDLFKHAVHGKPAPRKFECKTKTPLSAGLMGSDHDEGDPKVTETTITIQETGIGTARWRIMAWTHYVYYDQDLIWHEGMTGGQEFPQSLSALPHGLASQDVLKALKPHIGFFDRNHLKRALKRKPKFPAPAA